MLSLYWVLKMKAANIGEIVFFEREVQRVVLKSNAYLRKVYYCQAHLIYDLLDALSFSDVSDTAN